MMFYFAKVWARDSWNHQYDKDWNAAYAGVIPQTLDCVYMK